MAVSDFTAMPGPYATLLSSFRAPRSAAPLKLYSAAITRAESPDKLNSSEIHFRRRRDAVRPAVMGINPHEQRASIGMAEPGSDGRYIDAGFDGLGCERIAKIMVRQALGIQLGACAVEASLRFSDRKNWRSRINLRLTVERHRGRFEAPGADFLQ